MPEEPLAKARKATEVPGMSDFDITDRGSVLLIRPRSEAACRWLEENVVAEPWQWLDGALCVEAALARDLITEIVEQVGSVTG